jgi:hypothetical protein
MMRNARDWTAPRRVVAWLRKDYPQTAPAHGHSYLVALCGVREVQR